MSSYKHIKNRPTPKIGNTVRIKRVTGGYIIEIDSITNKALEYWRPLEVVCKSFNEVLLILKDWEHSPEESNNER